MNWVHRKLYLYNVAFGLYMLDWWERYLVNSLVITLMWFILYNGSRYFFRALQEATFMKPGHRYHAMEA